MSDSSLRSDSSGKAGRNMWSDLPDMFPVTQEEMDLIATHLQDILAEMLNDLD